MWQKYLLAWTIGLYMGVHFKPILDKWVNKLNS